MNKIQNKWFRLLQYIRKQYADETADQSNKIKESISTFSAVFGSLLLTVEARLDSQKLIVLWMELETECLPIVNFAQFMNLEHKIVAWTGRNQINIWPDPKIMDPLCTLEYTPLDTYHIINNMSTNWWG